jgi:hypothetical protein
VLAADQAANLRSLGRAIDEAQKEVRTGKYDPKLLQQLGMTFPKYQDFVESYAERFGKVKPMLEKTERPTDAMSGAFLPGGSKELQAGKGIDDKMGKLTGTENLTPDQIQKLFESGGGKVSPEYQKAVDAYFRLISESSRATPTSAPAK